MRKIVVLLGLLAILPVGMFADAMWGVGGAAFYKSPVLVGQPLDIANANVSQFSFGGDIRLKVDAFQAQALVLYSGGDAQSFNTYFDVGFAADISILRLSVGAGPNFSYNINMDSPVQAGFNAKVGADFLLGPVSLGISYIMALNISNNVTVDTGVGLLGAQIIFWL